MEQIVGLMAPLASDGEILRQSTLADELPNLESFAHLAGDPPQLRRFLRFIDYHLELARVNLEGKDVLDAGSGLGTNSIVFSVLAGKPCAGIEKSDHLFAVSARLMAKLPKELRPTIHHGDVVAMPFPDASFDVVTCFEALSHFRHPRRALEEMARVCRDGGVIVVSDGNNGMNASTCAKTVAYWRHFEKGPSRAFTPDGCHYIDVCYEDKRREILARDFPGIKAADRDRLAAATFGFNESELKQAAREYLDSGKTPNSFFDGRRVPVDPVRDDVRENLLDPLELCRILENLGFRASAHPYFGAARHPLIRQANRVVRACVSPRWTLRYSRMFIVTASKTGARSTSSTTPARP